MPEEQTRRELLQKLTFLPFLGGKGISNPLRVDATRLKVSLNAYSFNGPLTSGAMTLHDLLEFCARNGFDGVDLTGYYFPGYPLVASNDYLFQLKRKALKLGVGISGMGVRNDFSSLDAVKRMQDVLLVKNWIEVAAKMGAPVLRIFSGSVVPVGTSREQVLEWMTKDIGECAAYAGNYGVVLAVQNHHDFLKTAVQTIELIKRVDSPWFGLILDIGSFRDENPYDEIKQCIPYAVNWQIKERIYENNLERKVDLVKLFSLIRASEYRGYLPIETLGGDSFAKVPAFLAEVKSALAES